ncbi:hypothetical protein PPYR_12776 [Photinus pyralis]|uniref:Uncharacterized protein n=1 Tax=Photinus pyralis TaxID=7054 RepID=A0A5N4A751_PHOPY|nr:uncharacterized protein LOC116178653 [Photinus pyralis]KAB0793156.1 hypothetical protein PPYR_12776 [Photinus pyralis]
MKTVLAFFAISVVYAHAVFTGYYWRDYDASSIPCDAIQGGTDSYGHYTYIGLIALSDPGSLDLPDMVSATIYKGDKYAYSAYHSRLFKSDRGVKILCSADSKNVRWSKSLGNGCTLVRGSYRYSKLHKLLHRSHNLQRQKRYRKVFDGGTDPLRALDA